MPHLMLQFMHSKTVTGMEFKPQNTATMNNILHCIFFMMGIFLHYKSLFKNHVFISLFYSTIIDL